MLWLQLQNGGHKALLLVPFPGQPSYASSRQWWHKNSLQRCQASSPRLFLLSGEQTVRLHHLGFYTDGSVTSILQWGLEQARGSSSSGDSCAALRAESSACGCCHLLSPALSISSHLPSPGLLSWSRRRLRVTDPLCGCSSQGSWVAWGQGELQSHPAMARRRADVLGRLESPWGAGSLRGRQTSSALALQLCLV